MSRTRKRQGREPWLQAIGLAIRARREAVGISQEELGYRAGFHRTYVSDLERGRRNPTATTLLALASTLGTTVAAIAGDAEGLLPRDP